MSIKGIDISYWNETIDFNKVAADGIKFTILRSSYRNTVDTKFHEYAKQARSAGIPILGIYHFSYALNKEQAIKEAKFAVEQAQKAGLSKDTIIFFDFEYDTVTKAKNSGVILKPENCREHTVAFCEEVKQLGYKPGVYCNLDYYKHWYTKDIISKYIFWLADYSGSNDYPCDVHQYGSKGKVNGINGNVDMNYLLNEKLLGVTTEPIKAATTTVKVSQRQAVLDLIKSWEGLKESNGSFKKIIDIYNSYKGGLPRGVKMQYDWAWCACTWSALAIKLGYTDIMPIEISCGYLVENAKKMGCWVEQDSYVPKPGDAILYDWDDSGYGDNKQWPDHIGVVIEVNKSAGYMVVLEGNYGNSVKRRTVAINGKYIRGFISPKYTENTYTVSRPEETPNKSIKTLAKEVIAGSWGNGDERVKRLRAAGYDPVAVQNEVNNQLVGDATRVSPSSAYADKAVITSTCYAKYKDASIAGTYHNVTDLYIRNDAGTNKKVLGLLRHHTLIKNYGYYSTYNGDKWYYVTCSQDGIKYTGFVHSKYLKK